MKTPLTFGEGSDREWYIYDADENWIAEAVPSEPGEAEKTARRIVACVNACEGLPAGTIDGGWTAAGMSAYARKLEDALNEILTLPTERIAKAYVIAGAALALRHNAKSEGADAVLSRTLPLD